MPVGTTAVSSRGGDMFFKILRRLMIFLVIGWSSVSSAALLNIASGDVTAAPGDGMTATAQWSQAPSYARFEFKVEVDQQSGLYTYTYHWDGPVKNLSHILLEVSPSFTTGNIFTGTTPGWLINTWGNQGNSNPGIPDLLYGLKFEGVGGNNGTTLDFKIVTDRAPMWGNFYAKNGRSGGNTGQDVVAWNTAFGNPDVAWTQGSNIFGKILVPDTSDGGGGGGSVPEPGTLALALFGALAFRFIPKRKH